MQRATKARRATNIALPDSLLNDARSLGLNISKVCEQGVIAGIADRRRELWLTENRAALEA